MAHNSICAHMSKTLARGKCFSRAYCVFILLTSVTDMEGSGGRPWWSASQYTMGHLLDGVTLGPQRLRGNGSREVRRKTQEGAKTAKSNVILTTIHSFQVAVHKRQSHMKFRMSGMAL